MVKLFTDIDLDGLGCGLVAKVAFGDKVKVSYCSHRNLNYRVEAFLEDPENVNIPIFITDLSVNETVENKITKHVGGGGELKLIDHHVTALHLNKHDWGFVKPEDESGKKTSATSLFYEHLLEKNLIKSSPALDEFVELVRQYDTWEWELKNNLKAKRLNELFFIFSREQFEEEMLKRIKTNEEAFLLSESEEMILNVEENKIERYIHSKNRQIVQTMIDDYCVGIVHAEQYQSELGNELNKRNAHLDMIILVNAGTQRMSIRTIHDNVDVSQFAQRFGGGGHPKASGAVLTADAFEKFVINVFSIPPIKPDPEKNFFNLKESEYGTCYQNRRGEFSFIRPIEDPSWQVIHQGEPVEERFANFEDAERFVKRNYRSWLCFDDDFLQNMTRAFPLTKEELRKSYHVIREEVLLNQGDSQEENKAKNYHSIGF